MSRLLLFLGVCGLLTACGGDPFDEVGPEDELAANRAAGAIDSNGDIAQVTKPLAGTDLGVDLENINAIKAAKIRAARIAWDVNPCISIETDNLNFIEATFNDCRSFFGLVTVSGSLRASLDVELVPERAFTFELDSPGITITGPRGTREYSGAFSLHQVIADGTAVEYAGNLDYTDLDGSTLSYDAEAQWRIAGNCVNDLSGGATLSGDLLGELEPISLSGEGISRCQDACPTTGTVQLSYGTGIYLTWSYTGADTALVQGPNGKQVDVPLPCAE